MARDPSLDQRAQSLDWLPRLLCWIAKEPLTCLACGSSEVRPSAQRGRFDAILACFFLRPFRCRKCRARFFHLSRPASERPSPHTRAPLVVMPARRVLLELPQPAPIDWQPPRSILILDSDPAIRRLLRRVLERAGYCACELAAATDLPSELRARSVHLLIADCGLPDHEETELLAALAREHRGLKIIELSSQALDAGVLPAGVTLLPKPFPPAALLEHVRRLREPDQPARLRVGAGAAFVGTSS